MAARRPGGNAHLPTPKAGRSGMAPTSSEVEADLMGDAVSTGTMWRSMRSGLVLPVEHTDIREHDCCDMAALRPGVREMHQASGFDRVERARGGARSVRYSPRRSPLPA
jgi:hypothetical protein